MPTTEVKQLYNRSSIGQISGNSGCAPIGFGLIFMTVGGGIMIGANFLNDPNAPPVFVGMAFGGSFFLAGLLVAISGVRGYMLSRRAKSKQGSRFWEVDYAWDPAGTSSSSLKGFFGSLVGALFMAVFLTPFNWIALSEKDVPFFVFGIVGLFDLIVVAILLYAFYSLIRWMKYGTPKLEFERFPYFLGETFSAKFRARTIGRFNAFSMTLRCIEESTEGSGDNRTTVFRQIYADEIKIDKPGVHENLGDALPVTFNLPEGDYGTKIAGCSSPRYWELEIHADTPGVDFRAQFYLPIYAREQTFERTESTTEHTENTEEK